MGKFKGKTRALRAERGFMFVELLIVVVVIGLLAAIAAPVAGKWIRRSEDMAALASVRQVLAVARLEAIRRNSNVVVEISLRDNRIRLRTFQDRANDKTDDGKSFTSPLPGSTTVPPTDEALAAGNCVQDPTTGTFAKAFNADGTSTDELTLGDVSLSPRIHFWKHGGSEDDVADAIRFDTYLDTTGSLNPPCGSSTDRILFLPSGGISIPQAANSGPNRASATDERGIYFADWPGKNYFRVTVESNLSGKGRVEKWLDGASPPGYYAPSPANKWSWL